MMSFTGEAQTASVHWTVYSRNIVILFYSEDSITVAAIVY